VIHSDLISCPRLLKHAVVMSLQILCTASACTGTTTVDSVESHLFWCARAVTTIYLRPAVLQALPSLSQQGDFSMAQFLREAGDDLLMKYNVKVPQARTRK
jgi:hypothetical protein